MEETELEFMEWLREEIKSLREEANEHAELGDHGYAHECSALAREREIELNQHLRAQKRGVDLLTIELEDIHNGKYDQDEDYANW